jgi:hypothetical protein
MSGAYLLMDYVPWNNGASKPALLAWLENGRMTVHGLGVEPGAPFDPVAFAGVFPGELNVAWVFAEWVEALRDVSQLGAGLAMVRNLLEATPNGAIALREEGVASSQDLVLAKLPSGHIERRRVALDALAYLVRDESSSTITTQLKDRLLVGEVMLTVMRQGADWQVMGREAATRRAVPITTLSETGCRAKLRAWLAKAVP